MARGARAGDNLHRRKVAPGVYLNLAFSLATHPHMTLTNLLLEHGLIQSPELRALPGFK